MERPPAPVVSGNRPADSHRDARLPEIEEERDKKIARIKEQWKQKMRPLQLEWVTLHFELLKHEIDGVPCPQKLRKQDRRREIESDLDKMELDKEHEVSEAEREFKPKQSSIGNDFRNPETTVSNHASATKTTVQAFDDGGDCVDSGMAVEGGKSASLINTTPATVNGGADATAAVDDSDKDSTYVPPSPAWALTPSGRSRDTNAMNDNRKLVAVVNEQGKQMGEIYAIDRTTPTKLIFDMLALPIQRPIVVRLRQKTALKLRLAHTSEPMRWVALMTQATGTPSQSLCTTCSRGEGPFPACITGGPRAPDRIAARCGNCLWSQKGCHFGGGEPEAPPVAQDAPAVQDAPASKDASAAQEVQKTSSTVARPVRRKSGVKRASISGGEIDADDHSTLAVAHVQMLPNLRTSTINSRVARSIFVKIPGLAELEGGDADDTDSEDYVPPPTEVRSVSRPDDVSSPAKKSSLNHSLKAAMNLPLITQETLTLQHDGHVYTAPELMIGVPVEKISESHPYWEPSWESILPWLDAKQEAHPSHTTAERCRKIKEFLADSTKIHPCQIVGKAFLGSNFRKVFYIDRVGKVITALGSMPPEVVGVSPLDWFRGRLCEIYDARQKDFNLCAVLVDFLKDPKFMALRERVKAVTKAAVAGATRIPRKRTGTHEDAGHPKKKKRKKAGTTKSLSEGASTPSESPRRNHRQDVAASGTQEIVPLVQPPREMRQNGLAVSGENTEMEDVKLRRGFHRVHRGADSEEDEGYTSTDSFIQTRLRPDEFRIWQVKTPKVATSKGLSQYWSKPTFDGEPDELEHQWPNLEMDWSAYPDNCHKLNLRLSAVHELSVARDHRSLKVIMNRLEDDGSYGQIMGMFKRSRTKQRFLKYVKDMGVKVRNVSVEEIESRWDQMKAEKILDGWDELRAKKSQDSDSQAPVQPPLASQSAEEPRPPASRNLPA